MEEAKSLTALDERIVRLRIKEEETIKKSQELEEECKALGVDTQNLDSEKERLEIKLASIKEEEEKLLQEIWDLLDEYFELSED